MQSMQFNFMFEVILWLILDIVMHKIIFVRIINKINMKEEWRNKIIRKYVGEIIKEYWNDMCIQILIIIKKFRMKKIIWENENIIKMLWYVFEWAFLFIDLILANHRTQVSDKVTIL